MTGVGTPNYGRMVEAALKAEEAVAPLNSPSELHQCNSDADCSDICTYCRGGVGVVLERHLPSCAMHQRVDAVWTIKIAMVRTTYMTA